MYSDMSMRTMARSSSKRNSASARATSVLPTPVGPRKRKEPMGRLGSLRPARARRTAAATARDGVVLADHPFGDSLLHLEELLLLALEQPRHRDPGPLRHRSCDVLLADLLGEHGAVLLLVDLERLGGLFELPARARRVRRSGAGRRVRDRRRARRDRPPRGSPRAAP